MQTSIDINYAIERFGLYRVAFAGTLHFNSIIYRVVLGILFPEYAQVVALFTVVEFSLNAVFELPFGILADKYGRVKFAAIGLLMILISIVFTFLTVTSADMGIAKFYTVCAATLVGLGKPFFSGSVEAFYQDAIEARKVDDADHARAKSSFVLSSGFGKALPALYILGSFAIVAALYALNAAKMTFLFGASLYLLVIMRLLKDGKTLKDSSLHHRDFPSIAAIARILKTPEVIWASALKALSWLIIIYIMGHGIIVIANEKPFASDLQKIIVYFFFMLSFMGLGWFIRGSVNPYLFNRFNHQKVVLSSYLLWAAFNLAMFHLLPNASFIGTCILISIYMTVFQICYSMWQDWSANLVLKSVPREQYATALSLQNIPGFIMVSGMNLYFSTITTGFPSIAEMYQSLTLLSLIGALLMILFGYERKRA